MMLSFVTVWIVLHAVLRFVNAQDAPAAAPACDADNCIDCLTIACAWFPDGSCYETCSALPTEACYSDQFYGRQSPTVVCNRVEIDQVNSDVCSAVADCASCIATVQSDGSTPCEWYSAANTCGSSACTFTECGTTTCPAVDGAPTPTPVDTSPTAPTSGETEDCSLNTTNCQECLTDRESSANACAWVAGVCVNSCSDVPDLICYSAATFPEFADNATALCELEEKNTAGFADCGVVTNCTQCTATVQSDGISKCLWYEKSDSSVAPYCGAGNSGGSCDLNGICGVTDCSRIDQPMDSGSPMNNNTGNSTKANSNTTDGTSAAPVSLTVSTALQAIALSMIVVLYLPHFVFV